MTCDPAVFFAAMVSATTGPPATPMDSGQERIPSSGFVGQGVFAWQPAYHYATRWAGYALTSPANYTWYVQKTDGTNYVSGNKYDTSTWGPINVPGNNYRTGAQDHSSTAAAWMVFWGP